MPFFFHFVFGVFLISHHFPFLGENQPRFSNPVILCELQARAEDTEFRFLRESAFHIHVYLPHSKIFSDNNVNTTSITKTSSILPIHHKPQKINFFE